MKLLNFVDWLCVHHFCLIMLEGKISTFVALFMVFTSTIFMGEYNRCVPLIWALFFFHYINHFEIWNGANDFFQLYYWWSLRLWWILLSQLISMLWKFCLFVFKFQWTIFINWISLIVLLTLLLIRIIIINVLSTNFYFIDLLLPVVYALLFQSMSIQIRFLTIRN